MNDDENGRFSVHASLPSPEEFLLFSGYPPEKAAPVAIASVRKFLETSEISNKVLPSRIHA